jgi:hypothetical protein
MYSELTVIKTSEEDFELDNEAFSTQKQMFGLFTFDSKRNGKVFQPPENVLAVKIEELGVFIGIEEDNHGNEPSLKATALSIIHKRRSSSITCSKFLLHATVLSTQTFPNQFPDLSPSSSINESFIDCFQ